MVLTKKNYEDMPNIYILSEKKFLAGRGVDPPPPLKGDTFSNKSSFFYALPYTCPK